MKIFIPTLLTLIALIGYSSNALFAQNPTFPDELANIATNDSRAGWIKLKTDANFNQKSFLALLDTGDNIGDKTAYQLTNNTTDQFGTTRNVYQQTFKNIPIDNELWLLHSKNNRVFLAQGNIHLPSFENQQTIPAFSAAQGLEKILKHLKPIEQDDYPLDIEDLEEGIEIFENQQPVIEAKAGTLVWALDEKNNLLRLAYKYDVFTAEPLARKHYYIHAITGKIFKKVDLLTSNCFHESAEAHSTKLTNTTKNKARITADAAGSGKANYVIANDGIVNFTTDFSNNTYSLKTNNLGPQSSQVIETKTANNTTSTGNFTSITDSDNFWDTDSVAIGTHWGTELVYDYFLTKHNRNSYDNNGSPLLSVVHYDNNYVNAFWNGSRMTYGDGNGTSWGPLTSFDVIAHEIAHGVTEHNGTGGLIYQNESGALNESFSDIFGVVFEFEKHPDGGDWMMGEDFDLADHDGFRNMQNPLLKGHPKTYYGESWFTGTGDNGGVHINSGVQNYWFYLLSTGGQGSNEYEYMFDVIGIGLDDAAAIAYRNLTTYLHPNATFEDAKDGSIQAAIDLFGENAQQHLSTIEAWCAVGANPTCLPTINIDNINSNLTLISGTPYPIEWTSSSTDMIESVKIEYTTETGDNPTWILIEADYPNMGSYGWGVPNDPSTTVKIRITDNGSTTTSRVGNPLIHSESLPFTIESCSGAHPSFTEPAVIALNTSLTFTGNVEGDSYEWFLNGTSIATTKDLTYTFTEYGNYVLAYWVDISANQCIDMLERTYSFLPDNVCDARPLDIGVAYASSFEGATVEANEPAPPGGDCTTQETWCNDNLHRTLWYTFIAPTNGSVQIKTEGINNSSDTQIALYRGMDCTQNNPFQNAVLIAANDDIPGDCCDGSFIEQVCLIPGNIYHIQVDEWTANEGDFTITVEEVIGNCNLIPNDTCRLQDSLVLVDMYNALDGANWTNTWDLSEPLDSFYGVTLSEYGCVTELDLDGSFICSTCSDGGNNLNGTLPNSFWNLKELTTLSLARNALLAGSISSNVENLKRLKIFHITNTDFSGSLPNEIGKLHNLTFLNLSYNEFNGVIPDSIGNLTALNNLNLSGNNFTKIPAEIANLANLGYFFCSDNEIDSLPDLSLLTQLRYLHLYNNQLVDSIPSWIGNLTNLYSLNLRDNQLKGTIPAVIGNLTNLKYLYLYNNQLTGAIPSSVGDMINLRYLYIYNNQLTDTIPASMSHLNLIYLYAYNNQLTGNIPDIFGNMSNLYRLRLANNRLSGLVPSFESAPNFDDFEIHNNQFTFEDILPHLDSIAALIDRNDDGLSYKFYDYAPQDSIFKDSLIIAPIGDSIAIDLVIDDTVTTNQYQWYKDGQVYLTITGNNALTFSSLQASDAGVYYCDITNPNAPDLTLKSRQITLEVTAPPCRALDSLVLVDLYNSTDGANWRDTWDLTMPMSSWDGVGLNENGCVAYLERSNNRLSGPIPASIGNLTNLYYLNFNYNQLTGPIPNTIGNLTNLALLDFNSNQLTGIIPDTIGNLTRLYLLRFSGNQLTGVIPPDVIEKLTLLEHLSLSSNQLTGTIPNAIGSLIRLGHLYLDNNQLTGMIPDTIGKLIHLTHLGLGNNQLEDTFPYLSAQMSGLKQLRLGGNRLRGLIPSFYFTDDFGDFEIQNNQFTFEDILPYIKSIQATIDSNNDGWPNWYYEYQPQDSIFKDSTVIALAGDSLAIDLLIDDTVTTNQYQWYKDGEVYSTIEGSNKLIFNKLKLTDAGIYRVDISNPNAPNLTLHSRNITLNIEPNICVEKDSLALIDLYNATDGANWTIPWDLNQPMTTWYGVFFNEIGCVNRLDLDGRLNPQTHILGGNNLKGVLPDSFFNIINLEILSLSGNNLLEGELPSAIQNFTELTYLGLSNANFSGVLPHEIGNLPLLESLFLANNKFEGGIPESFTNLHQLQSLNLSSNTFTTIPNLSALNKLKRFYIGNNQIGSDLFSWLEELTELINIELNDNLIASDISNFNPNWPNAAFIDFSNNQLQGTLNNWNTPRIERLLLNNNQLSNTEILTSTHLLFPFFIDNNRLSFEDIIPNLAAATNYKYTPQAKIGSETTIAKNIGNFLVLDLEIDANISTNQYKWFKDGEALITIDGFNKLVFNSVQLSDEGVYRCEITNPNAPDLTLMTYDITLDITDPICHASDSLALIDFYNATDGVNWTNAWDLSQPMNTWYGVTLNNRGCVEKINLSGELNPSCELCFGPGNNLIGSIPKEIGNLSYLTELLLSSNSLSGEIPKEIGNLANLKNLTLFGNFQDTVALTGNLPIEIGDLANLEVLILDGNQLNGVLPNEINNLEQLRILSIPANNFEGALPDLSNLNQLTHFIIAANSFTGNLPNWLYSLDSLMLISASNNSFEGNISPDFQQLTQLQYLSLGENNLTGNIPTELGNNAQLTTLLLNNNQLTGSIPNSLTNLDLERLVVYDNQLAGNIPDFTSKNKLHEFLVDGNLFTFEDIIPLTQVIANLEIDLGLGYFPQATIYKDTTFIRDIGDSLTIDLAIDDTVSTNVYEWYKDNQIIATIHGDNEFSLTNLQPSDAGLYFCLVNNPHASDLTLITHQIIVNITPCSVTDSLALVEFYQATDGSNWEIPWNLAETMDNWEGVVLDVNGCVATLNLQNNNLSKSLPTALNDLNQLNTLRLENNQLTGPIPADLSNLNLTILTIDNNHLTDTIPDWIVNMDKLKILRLSNNQLTGNIPDFSIGCPNLQDLEVDRNQFTFESLLPDFLPNQTLISNNATANSHNFDYVPQDSVYQDTFISRNAGQDLTIDLDLDNTVPYNIFEWYKNNQLHATIYGVNRIDFDNLQTSDEGVYYCKITNTAVPNLTLVSRAIIIAVKDCTLSLAAGEQICNEQNNTFSQAIQVTYSDAPDKGVLLINEVAYPITESPQSITLTDLTPTSAPTRVTASFSILPNCSLTVNDLFTPPTTCIGTCDETDMEVSNPVESKTYQAEQTIHSTATIEQDYTTIFKAGQSITLATGFHAMIGSNFTAQIVACDNAANLEIPSTQKRTTAKLPNTIAQDLTVRPNPFRNQTTIDYTLTENQTVSLAIYTATGQLIKTLVAKASQNSGFHTYEFDGNQLKGGMYVVVLQTEARTMAQKIILIE